MRRLALFLVVWWAAACGGDVGPVVVAVVGPFSQPRGVSMRLAAQLAEREINARGGVRGRRFQLVFADDSARDSVAIRIARRFRDDPRIVAVVGHVTSVATLAAAPLYAAGKDPLPLISPSASSPELSGISQSFFRVCPSDLAHGPRLARFVRQRLRATTAGLIYLNDDYGRGVRRTFAAEFTRLGGRLVADDPTLPSTPLEPYLARMRRRGGVDVLVLAVERPTAELALRDLAALGLGWPVVGGDALTGLSGPHAEGVHISSAYLPDRPGTLNAAFIETYARAYAGQTPDHRGAGTYDVLHLLERLINAGAVDRRTIREQLAKVGGSEPAFEGVTGTIAFDEAGDVPGKPVAIGVVRNGRLVSEIAP